MNAIAIFALLARWTTKGRNACMRLGLVLATALSVLSACGGAGGVSGGGTGGGSPTPVSIVQPANLGGAALSASSVSGLGSATVYLGAVAFEQSAGTLPALDGLPFGVQAQPGAQLAVVPVSRSFELGKGEAVAQRFAWRAAVGLLEYNPQAAPRDQLRVNNQRILVNRFTVLVGVPQVADLAGKAVAVAGYLETIDNDIIATRIEALPEGTDLAGQQVVTASVQSVDAQAQLASLGFASLQLQNISLQTPVRVGQVLHIRARASQENPGALSALSIVQLGAFGGQGDLVLRAPVSSRPNASQPSKALVVGGYSVDVSSLTPLQLQDIRLGSVVEVIGALNGQVITPRSLRLISNPVVLPSGETEPPPDDPKTDDEPREDYQILDAEIEQLDAVNRRFVLRGLRVQLHDGQSPVELANGQQISVAGETRNDEQGQYLLVKVLN
jgi:hypothetical protein